MDDEPSSSSEKENPLRRRRCCRDATRRDGGLGELGFSNPGGHERISPGCRWVRGSGRVPINILKSVGRVKAEVTIMANTVEDIDIEELVAELSKEIAARPKVLKRPSQSSMNPEDLDDLLDRLTAEEAPDALEVSRD